MNNAFDRNTNNIGMHSTQPMAQKTGSQISSQTWLQFPAHLGSHLNGQMDNTSTAEGSLPPAKRSAGPEPGQHIKRPTAQPAILFCSVHSSPRTRKYLMDDGQGGFRCKLGELCRSRDEREWDKWNSQYKHDNRDDGFNRNSYQGGNHNSSWTRNNQRDNTKDPNDRRRHYHDGNYNRRDTTFA